MSEDRRAAARELAHEAISAGEPLRWFEDLYRAAETDGVTVPWAEFTVNPHLASWSRLADLPSGRALVVGCGYGDDAEWLAGQGWDVTAFDIADTAVERARERFACSPVDYAVADLLQVPVEWTVHRFDLVVEAYTIQVLPPGSAERAAAIRALAEMTGQTLLVIARGCDPGDDIGSMPWPVAKSELGALSDVGLDEIEFEDFADDEVPPARRFRITYQRRRPLA